MSMMVMDDDLDNKVTVLLIGVGSAALVVTIYHCIAMGWRNRDPARANSQRLRQSNFETNETASGIENSTALLIPAFKYHKGMGLDGGGGDEGTCAICLGEFEEGEELRILPECMHSYHVACIDMWLYSHSNCPVCRTDAISPQLLLRMSNVSSEEPTAYDNITSGLQNVVVVQSRNL
ncbi:hypothetical protein JCGZ_01485 [Jatropha curcas]|uniref:RING-type E3 ubiquitin transferase n=2 Tax=Jatropha curcas TaxID=180498 RepID=A0A067LJX7_JATCU|nr:hypothetical protein JCGZ_01485 [Jatropha curcas]